MTYELACVGRQRVEIAHADCQLAKRPRIGESYRTDRHRPLGTLHGRLGHDAYADIALDQSANRIEAAQLHAQTQRTTDTVCLVREKALDCASSVKSDHVVVEHLGECDA